MTAAAPWAAVAAEAAAVVVAVAAVEPAQAPEDFLPRVGGTNRHLLRSR